jgi:glycosyltransferase involved in cell wall biosynthesis
MDSQLNQQSEDIEILVSQPFFSIVITTFNRSQLIKRALNSMVSQVETDWEAIIVDDESEDDTYSQVLPYLRSHNKIKYFRIVHGGEATAKNQGIKSSCGRFISFLDSDDEYDPIHLKSRKSILIQNPEVRFLYGGVKILGNQFVPDRTDPAKKINLANCAIGGTFFVERNTLKSLNGFKQILLGPDADLFERAKMNRITMMETKLPTYIYHHDTSDSITNKLYFDEERGFMHAMVK